MNAKAHNQNRAAAVLRERRRANKKRTLSTYVAKVAQNSAEQKAVTNALRTVAKKLRESGALGKVQTKIGYVTETHVGPTHRYTAAQTAMIASVYRPRKAEYKEIRSALIPA